MINILLFTEVLKYFTIIGWSIFKVGTPITPKVCIIDGHTVKAFSKD